MKTAFSHFEFVVSPQKELILMRKKKVPYKPSPNTPKHTLPCESVTRTSPDVKVPLFSVLGVNVPSNQLWLHSKTMTELGVKSGGFARVQTEIRSLILLVMRAPAAVPSNGAAVSPETGGWLGSKEAELSLFIESVPLCDTITLNLCSSEATDGPIVDELSSDQVHGAFRALFQNSSVFIGMECKCRVATVSVIFTVVACHSKGSTDEPVVFFVSSATEIILDHPRTAHHGTPEEVMSIQQTLFVGESGTGKSYELHRIMSSSTVTSFPISLDSLVPSVNVTSAGMVREAFRLAAALKSPAIVTIDDIDVVCGSGSAWNKQLMSTVLCDELDRVAATNVVVVATAASTVSLPEPVARRFHTVKQLSIPTSPSERLKVMEAIISRSLVKSLSAETLEMVSQNSHGFSQRDLAHMFKLASALAFERSKQFTVSDEDLCQAASRTRPSTLRNFDTQIPKVHWNDIGGSECAKKALQECVEWCLGKRNWMFVKFNLSPPKGVLLFGPPGCSKTMLAKALANESKMNFISIKGPEVFSKWVGDSEKAVRSIFHQARAAAPCVIFIDELDGMCGRRGHGGVSDRVISQFLTELDGLPAMLSKSKESLLLVAATNRPENIDPAVLRPGRIDRKVFVGLPCVEEREAIASISFARIPIAADVSPMQIAQGTEGYTGAEVVAVCKEAAFAAVRESLQATQIEVRHVAEALSRVQPRISTADVEWYKQWAAGAMR